MGLCEIWDFPRFSPRYVSENSHEFNPLTRPMKARRRLPLQQGPKPSSVKEYVHITEDMMIIDYHELQKQASVLLSTKQIDFSSFLPTRAMAALLR